MDATKVLCWDLDENLGIFDNVVYDIDPSQLVYKHLEEYAGFDEELDTPASNSKNRRLYLRPGLEEALQKTIHQGFTNVITTSSRYDYAQRCLEFANLKRYFQKIYSFYQMDKKDYLSVAKDIKLVSGCRLNELAVLSHTESDAPYNSTDIVFILDRTSTNHHASLITNIISTLSNDGNLELLAGFQAFMKKNTALQVHESVMNLRYLHNRVPTLEVISSPHYALRELIF